MCNLLYSGHEMWGYQWMRHGTCSGLSQSNYFSSAIALIKALKTPKVLMAAVGGGMSTAVLRDSFGGKGFVSLRCSDGNYLTEVYTCWDKDDDNLPTGRTNCPKDVLKADNCDADVLQVVAFKAPKGQPASDASNDSVPEPQDVSTEKDL